VNLRRYRLSAVCQPTGCLALGHTPKHSKIGLKVVGATGFEPATPCAQGKLGVAFEVLFSEQFTASENCCGRFCGRVPGERRTIVGMWSDSVFARRRTSCENGVEGRARAASP
jgi:hypothetical protein